MRRLKSSTWATLSMFTVVPSILIRIWFSSLFGSIKKSTTSRAMLIATFCEHKMNSKNSQGKQNNEFLNKLLISFENINREAIKSYETILDLWGTLIVWVFKSICSIRKKFIDNQTQSNSSWPSNVGNKNRYPISFMQFFFLSFNYFT